MADVKTIIIETPRLALETGPGSKEFLEGGAVFARVGDGGWPGAPIFNPAEAEAANAAEALERLAAGKELTRLRLEGPDFDASLAAILDQSDRRTVFAVVTSDQVVFHGYGIAAPLAEPGAAAYQDVLPTLAMIGDFYLAREVELPDGGKLFIEGRVLFEVLKNPSLKQSQIDKLKGALGRLETMLKRGNREPWEKHDCA